MDGSCFTKVGGVKQPFSLKRLRGRLAYIYQVRGKGPKPKSVHEDGEPKGGAKFWASTNLFECFLNYADLYGAELPVLLCEGVTDSIYIRSALQTLAPKYPTLITAANELRVKFFKYNKTAAAIQHLSGGSGELVKLVREYRKRTEKFKVGAGHPLILIADSDDGSKELFKEVLKRTGYAVDGTRTWYHVIANLYVIPIPKIGTTETPIERLFEQAVLDEVYEGKKFDITNLETDGRKFYGKKVFATKIIAAKKHTIKFDGFEPLLAAIAEVVEDYKTRVSVVGAPTAAALSASAAV